MIVEITSLVPKNALKTPAIPDQIAPHNAPHKMEPMIKEEIAVRRAREVEEVAE